MYQERCPNCPSRNLPPKEQKNVVPGEGPKNARTMVVLEAPGRMENNFRRPACGKTGEELNNTYLPLAGLSRPDVWVTNACKCHWADSSDAPPDDLVRSCADFHLRRELKEINPKVVVLAGGVSNSLFDLDVEMEHGLGRIMKLYDWEGKVFSTFHPARGMHQGNAMQQLLDDFTELRGFRTGQVPPFKDEYPNPQYFRLRTREEVEAMTGGDIIAIDTESIKRWRGYHSTIRYIPWCLTYCMDPGEAFMIRVVDEDAMRTFSRLLPKFKKIVFHNAPHDMNVLAMMDVGFPLDYMWEHLYDTMASAYHDARMAKGLKYLAHRLLGANVLSFDELVVPYGRERAWEYIEQVAMMTWPDPVQEPTGEMVTKKCPECKGTSVLAVGRGKARRFYDCGCDSGMVTVPVYTRRQGISQKISRLITDFQKNPDVKIWERWDNWGPEVIDPLVAKLGPIPLPSIEMVPEEKAIQYACGDAHNTRRIFPILQHRLVQLRREVR